jgi:hypothetical protein
MTEGISILKRQIGASRNNTAFDPAKADVIEMCKTANKALLRVDKISIDSHSHVI